MPMHARMNGYACASIFYPMASWRNDKPVDDWTLKKSRGINPKYFHSRNGNEDSPERNVLKKLHAEVRSSFLENGKKKVTSTLQAKRSAFKSVTFLKTFPLQEQAFQALDEIHIGFVPEKESILDRDQPENGNCSSQSTSSSSISNAEAKRLHQSSRRSPAQSSLKATFVKDFNAEKERKNSTVEEANTFLPALWSVEPRIFSMEKSSDGKRRYLVGHLGRLFDTYWRKTDPRNRCFYELIRENTACRLYFDLEFSKLSNDIHDAEAEVLIDELIQETATELTEKFQLTPIDRSHVVDLDSSIPKKFSRHLIFHLPGGVLFEDAAQVGLFVSGLVSKLAQGQSTGVLKRSRPYLAKYFLVKVPPSNVDCDKMTCFVDTGVYTRNRLFRILGSSKFGKPAEAALRIAKANRFPFPDGFCNSCFYLPDVLKQPKGAKTELTLDENFDVDEAINQFMESTDWSKHADALADTLVVPMNASKICFPTLPKLEEPESVSTKGCVPSTVKKQPQLQSYGESTFPMVDTYVRDHLANRNGSHGAIRSWSLSNTSQGAPGKIVYQMSRNRYCERIGRCHKSNNIMWNVDLKLFHCYQSCHDPECRALQFTGKPVPLPKAVRDAVDDALFEWHLANVDESSLYASCREVVSPNTTMVHLQSEVSTLSLASQPSVTPDSQEDSLEAHKNAPADSSRLPPESTATLIVDRSENKTDDNQTQNDDSDSDDDFVALARQRAASKKI